MQIHFIAIGGAIMHQLAIALQRKGYQISGSDDEINDPAKNNLREAGILPELQGWFPHKIHQNLDAVVLGMHAKSDNAELIKAKELNLPIYSFPEYIFEVAKDKKRVVIAGSHGKTTTTSMVMHVLQKLNIEFDYLVGAKVEGFDSSVKISQAPIMIIEGDEYPASALEPRPKIHFYHPHISVLTGIAWDHVNVFPTFEIYKNQFVSYVEKMEKKSTLIYNAEDTEVVKLTEKNAKHLVQMPYVTPEYKIANNATILKAGEGDFELYIFGPHNLQNMEAARKVCNQLGVENTDFYSAICSFKGAAKRMEKLQERAGIVVYRDFAHAPSKLIATIRAARVQYPDHHLIACFELHTYSSLNADFLSEYAHTMTHCDSKAVFFSTHALALKGLPTLDSETVKAHFQDDSLVVFQEKEGLKKWINCQIREQSAPVCLLLMSSGIFDGMDLSF